jgi:hypothetical protein
MSSHRSLFLLPVGALIVLPALLSAAATAQSSAGPPSQVANQVAPQTVPVSPGYAVQGYAPAGSAQSASAQDQADIARVETYLNGLKSLKAHFVQVAGDGAMSQGTAWLERPGRMRFQYNPPAPFLLIAAHGVLTFNDSSLRQASNIPLTTDRDQLLHQAVRRLRDAEPRCLQHLCPRDRPDGGRGAGADPANGDQPT